MYEKDIILAITPCEPMREDEKFYKVKNKILTKYGQSDGYDVQFIEGKKCYSCDGTGVFVTYRYDRVINEQCYRCFGGWYKRPVWNVLLRVKMGKYVFHQPYERCYSRPDVTNIIEGYISHNKTKYSSFAKFVLLLCYEKNYMKRWYENAGFGWRIYWWRPRNWVHNIIYLYKRRKRMSDNDLPF